jgi:single-strand DNA-binding protein
MNESLITLQGWLGSDVSLRQAGGATVASFRLGCTPRRYQKKTDSWVDGDTQWYTVNAWRALGENCDGSLRRGDPVVVSGRVNAETWTNKGGIEVTSFSIDASFVGHDLNRGRSEFTKTGVRQASESDAAVVEAPGAEDQSAA